MKKIIKIIFFIFVPLILFSQEKNYKEKIIKNIMEKELPELTEEMKISRWDGKVTKDSKFNLILIYIPKEYSQEAFLSFYNILDSKGNYKKIIDYKMKAETEDSFGPFSPSIRDCRDINGDGTLEIWLIWSIGAIRPINNQRFLKFDYLKKEILPLQILNKDSIYFMDFETGWAGSSGGMWASELFLEDIDNDKKYEIIQLNQYSEKNIYSNENLKVEKWEIDLYKWDGNFYKYIKELSLDNNSKKIPKWVKKLKPEVFPFEKNN